MAEVDVQTVKKNNRTVTDYVFAVGRRKQAVARIRLYNQDSVSLDGKELKRGDFVVNNKPVDAYFGAIASKEVYLQAFTLTNTGSSFITTVRVVGGGLHGQLEATVHGIARALDAYDTNRNRSSLKKHGLLTRDQRVRLRRNVGTGGKARRQKQSPKR